MKGVVVMVVILTQLWQWWVNDLLMMANDSGGCQEWDKNRRGTGGIGHLGSAENQKDSARL